MATRFYRAPELILLEKDYGKAVDIWACGVIFGELLLMLEENCPNLDERKCLFPGKQCFPLSPNKKFKLDEHGIPPTNGDQLEYIFNLTGLPSKADTSFVTDAKAQLYLDRFDSKDLSNLEEKFPNCEPEGRALLKSMLKFNPFFRPTTEECLANPYFSKVKQFSEVQDAGKTISFAFETKSFVSMVEIRQLMINEIAYY